jgi:hypothetical protein
VAYFQTFMYVHRWRLLSNPVGGRSSFSVREERPALIPDQIVKITSKETSLSWIRFLFETKESKDLIFRLI